MAENVVDEFCTNEEVRVRRFATKHSDRDPRAQALIEIAERLKSLAAHQGSVGSADAAEEMTHAQWASRLLAKIVEDGNARHLGLPELIRIVAGMCGHLIACSAPPEMHAKLVAFAERMLAESLVYQTERGRPAGATVQ
jgi:hypothetical protein